MKYNTNSSYRFVDNKTVLDSEDDVAHLKLGDSWCLPKDSEWKELMTKCTWTWTDNYNSTGVRGRIVTASNGNSIFLPAAGGRYEADLYDPNYSGFYWSSSLSTIFPSRAYGVFFDANSFYRIGDEDRYYGSSVRPVSE